MPRGIAGAGGIRPSPAVRRRGDRPPAWYIDPVTYSVSRRRHFL